MKRFAKEQFDKLIVLVVAPVFTFLIDYLLGIVGENVSFGLIILTYGAILLSYWVIVFVVSLRGRVEESEKDKYIEELKGFIEEIKGESKKVQDMMLDMESLIEQSRSELLTNEQLAIYERRVETDEIWVVEHDLYLEVNDEAFVNTLDYNLSRGVIYSFFIPEIPQNINYIHQLIERVDYKENLNIYYLGEEYYLLSPNSDYTIYNPNNKNSGEECYIGMSLGNREGAFNARLSKSETSELIGNLRMLKKEDNRFVEV